MATQTGSIDLEATNAAKLYAEAGFTNAAQTYATKSELTVSANQIRGEVAETYATKDEAALELDGSGKVVVLDEAADARLKALTIHGLSVQDGTPTPSAPVAIESVRSPNLQPFFSKDFTDTSYWFYQPFTSGGVSTDTTPTATKLDDGWAHVEWSGTVSRRQLTATTPAMPTDGSIKPSSTYTLMVEVRNYSATGTNAQMIFPATDGTKAPWTTNTYQGVLSNGVFYYTAATKADISAANQLRCFMVACNGVSTSTTFSLSFDIRLSLYEGTYYERYIPVGAIQVTSMSTNRFDASVLMTAGNTNATVSDGTVTVSAADASGWSFAYASFPANEGETYTVSATVSGSSPRTFLAFNDATDTGTFLWGGHTCNTGSVSVTGTAPSGTNFVQVFLYARQTSSGAVGDSATYGKVQLELGSTATAYEPYSSTTTPIPVTLRSLPDGTHDEWISGETEDTLIQRVGETMQAVTDGVTGTVGVDVLSSTGEIANGAQVIYKLATPVTTTLAHVNLPYVHDGDSVWVDAQVTPNIDVAYWSKNGETVSALSSTLTQTAAGLELELQGKVDSDEEWVSWMHAGTDATTHEPYLAMGQDSDYPSVVYGSDAARFYDGEGDADSNVVASFGAGGAVVGNVESSHTSITPEVTAFHDANGNEAARISMSDQGAVTAWASYSVNPTTSWTDRTETGITPLPDFTLGDLELTVSVDGVMINSFSIASFTEPQISFTHGDIDIKFQATKSGDTWTAAMSCRNRDMSVQPTVTFGLSWEHIGTAPMWRFGGASDQGAYSFSAGDGNQPTGEGAVTLGLGLKANSKAQVVVGKYNKPYQSARFIVGNGTDDAGRSNALAVTYQGIETVGYIQTGGTVGLCSEAQQGWLTALFGMSFVQSGTYSGTVNVTSSWYGMYYGTVTIPITARADTSYHVQATATCSGNLVWCSVNSKSTSSFNVFVISPRNSAQSVRIDWLVYG